MADLAINGRGFMNFESADSAMKYAEMISISSFCPKEFKGKPGDVLCAIQYGAEVGLLPMQALQNIYVINGKPSMYGDALLAICKAGSDFEYIKENFEYTGSECSGAYCEVKRMGEPAHMVRFSVEHAKKAGLWRKSGPWTTYPDRMLQMRARGFALRDVFPHLLKGILPAEEVSDYPVIDSAVRQSKKNESIEARPPITDLVNYSAVDEFIDANKIDEKIKDRLLKKLKVESFDDISKEDEARCIEYLKKIMENNNV